MVVLRLALNIIYLLLVLAALPMVVWKRVRTGKYRIGLKQKLFGTLPVTPKRDAPRVWLHAVSVGEVLQLRQIVERLLQSRPDVQILISTTTETGYAVAREKFPGCEVTFFPLDFSWSVREALQRVQPDLIVLVELELWPNFIFEAARRQIPLALINGRLSARSYRGYSRLRPLVQRLLSSFSVIGVQTEEYLERFVSLGANPGTTIETGSIKFDGVSTNTVNPETDRLRAWIGVKAGTPVFVAGSTQAPEEEYAIQSYQQLLKTFPTLRLCLVPRHPERGYEIVELIQRYGFSVQQRSSNSLHSTPESSHEGNPVVALLDTVGELGACWGLADVAFVGGSFSNRGGQNMLEPSAFGAAVCFGPNTWNFKQIVELLLSREAARQVRSQQEMQEFVLQMLSEPDVAVAMGTRARQLVLSQQGATDRTIALLLEHLPESAPELKIVA